jgi:FAD/FMN-containing dehydrogenase
MSKTLINHLKTALQLPLVKRSHPAIASISPRRRFLKGLFTTVSIFASTSLLTPLRVMASINKGELLQKFRHELEGSVFTNDDEKYEIHRLSLVWQMLKPQRYPALIVQVASVEDVIRTVNFARESNYQVSVRCGGHNYYSSFLADGVLVLDISQLYEIEVDPVKRTASIGPGIRGVSLIGKLARYDLAFPVAHCGSVAMGGYLLGGGHGWNAEAWGGLACMNIEEIEVVTADGELVTANKKENADLYWAARGAGPCFFGVVTNFIIKVYENPKSVMSSSYVWPVEDAEEVCAWANKKTREIPDYVELWFLMGAAPVAEDKKGSSDKICMVLARAYGSDKESAYAALASLSQVEQEVTAKYLSKDEFSETTITSLIHETDAESLPWHWSADNLYTDRPPHTLAAQLIDHMSAMPSAKSAIIFIFKPHSAQLADSVLPMTGQTFVGCYNIWTEAAEILQNIKWRDQTMNLAESYIKGHYINEADFIARPSRVKNSFTKPGWQKLQALHQKHDPNRIFHTQLN